MSIGWRSANIPKSWRASRLPRSAICATASRRLPSRRRSRAHAVDLARDNYATSKAAYEAMLETQDEQNETTRARRQQRVQIGLSVALPVAFMFAGIPLFMHGREITSLSFTALGFFLVLVAVVLAAASLIMLFKPGRKGDERSQRVQDRHWVMLQDKKKLEACLAEQEHQRQAVQAELAAMGLSEAKDSLRHARALLDEAKDVRAENALYMQRKQALVSRRTALEESLEGPRNAGEPVRGDRHAPRTRHARTWTPSSRTRRASARA